MCLDSSFSSLCPGFDTLPWAHEPRQGLRNSCWDAAQTQGMKAGRYYLSPRESPFLQRKEGNLSLQELVSRGFCVWKRNFSLSKRTSPFLLCVSNRPLWPWQLWWTSFKSNEVLDQLSWVLGQHEEVQHTSQMTKMRCSPGYPVAMWVSVSTDIKDLWELLEKLLTWRDLDVCVQVEGRFKAFCVFQAIE